MISWESCKDDFAPDGSLRDIYLTPATLEDWEKLFQWLKTQSESEYSLDGSSTSIPENVASAFADRESKSPLLSVSVGPTYMNFHFFSEDEIECDFLPNDIKSQQDLDALLSFMRQISTVLGRESIMTAENTQELTFIRYSPSTDSFIHTPLYPL